MLSLTERVIQFQESGVGLQAITEEILRRIYRYPLMHRGFVEDDCGEFCLHFYPRIERLVQRFRFCGIPFEAYLATNVRWQLKSYVTAQRTEERRKSVRNLELLIEHRQQQRTSLDTGRSTADSDAELPISVCRLFGIQSDGTVRTATMRRRLLILAMKGCTEIKDDQLLVVAEMTGDDPDWVLECAAALRDTMARRELRAEKLRLRRNKAFLRLRVLQDQLDNTVEDSRRRELETLLVQCRLRLKMARLCLSRVPRHPTHEDLARVLHIPKGSVDSSFYYLRRSLDKQRRAVR